MYDAAINAPRVGRVEDIDGVGDAIDWLQGAVSGQLPNILSIALGGGITGFAAKTALSKAARGAVKAKIKQGIKREVAEKQVAAKLVDAGRNLGVVLSSAGLESGGMWGEDAAANGAENANWKTAAAFGGLAGVTEMFSPVQRFASGLGRATKTVNGKGAFRKIGKGLIADGLGETSQEITQEALGVANAIATGTEDSFFSEEAISRYLNAGLTAFATGGLIGGVRTALNKKTWETIDDVIHNDVAQKEDEAKLNAIVDEVDGTPNITASDSEHNGLDSEHNGLDSEHNGQTETVDDVLQEKTISPARQELHDAFGEDGVAALENTDRIGFVPSQEEAQKVIDETEDEMRFSRENTFPWPDDFPKSTLQTNLSKLKNHPSYEAAKAGDMEAAEKVILDIIKPEKIKALKQKHPDAIVVAPHAEESSGRNALPETFAKALGRAGFSVDRNIVQINRPQRTKKGHELRLAMRPEFGGKVEKGREYILLDDAVGQGGTASELRFFIERNGGKVVGFSHLAAGRTGGTIAVQKPTLQKLKEKFGDERLNRFLDDFNIAGRADALTEGEAKYLLKQSSLNSLRDRIFKSARESNIGLQSWGVRSSLQVKYSKDGKIQGFVLGGKTYLVEDGIPQGHAKNVLHHEIGTHVRQLLFKDEHFNKLLSTLERRSKNNTASGKALRRAMARVPEDTPAEHYWEEVAAYVVEDTANASIIREIIALIKKAVNELLGGRAARLFNEKDLRALAQVALKREVKEQKKEGKKKNFDGNNPKVRRSKAKRERLEKLKNSKSVEITGREIPQSKDLKQYKRNALAYGKMLRGTYTNKDTGRSAEVVRQSLKEVLQHNFKDIPHLQSVAAIPQIIENGIYIETLPNEEAAKNPGVKKYEYYVVGLKIGGEDYTVKFVVGVTEEGNRYYDHHLTEMEKGALLSTARITNPEAENNNALSKIEDKRLLQILQEEKSNSKVKFSKAKTAEAEQEAPQKQAEREATEEREKTLYQNLKETFSDHPFSASIKEKYPDLTLLVNTN